MALSPIKRAFRVLGPLEVLIAGDRVPVASTRQRIILAMLLMAANRVVTLDVLIEAIWDGEPPSTARSQVQICISALRRALGPPDIIETCPNGYRIRLLADELDYSVFVDAASRSRADSARGDLRQSVEGIEGALRLWNGPALAGVPGRVVEGMANRFEELRITAIEARIELRLAMGEHCELVGEIVSLTAEHPLRERLWGFQMLALYRSGRQAEALTAYRTARRGLVEELGLEPGEGLRDLERAILSHDPNLTLAESNEPIHAPRAADPYPQQLPADIPDFVGHAELIETLSDILTCVEGPTGAPYHGTTLLTGMPGCGKSAIAVHAAHRLRGTFPDGQIFINLHGSSGNPMPAAEALSFFLRALGVAHDAVPIDYDERVNLLRTHTASRRLLVVLDDAANEEQIRALLPGEPGSAILITSRSKRAAPLGTYVAEIPAMSDAEGRELLEKIAGPGRIGHDEVDSALLRLCCGLPLALRSVGARLASHRQLSVQDMVNRLADLRYLLDEVGYVGVGIRQMLGELYAPASTRAKDLLRLLSTLEMHDLSAYSAAAALDCDLEAATQLLEELADARLLEVTDGVSGQPARYGLHDLVRAFAREKKTAEDAGEAAAVFARVISCLTAIANEAHKREYAGYALLNGAEDWPGARQYFDQLLPKPIAWFNAERASLREGVAQAASLGLDERCWQLAVSCAVFYAAHGLFDEWRDTHTVALRSVRETRNRRGQAAVLASLGSLGVAQHSGADERMLLESLATFEEFNDVSGTAFALRMLADIDRIQGRSESAVERYELALDGFRTAEDAVSQAQVLTGLAGAYSDMGRLDHAEMLAKDSLLVALLVPSPRFQAHALHRLGDVFFRQTQMLAAKAVFLESLRLAEQVSDHVSEAYALNGLAAVALGIKDLSSAEDYLTQAADICRDTHERNIGAHTLLGLGRVNAQLGDHDRAVGYYLRAALAFASQGNNVWHAQAVNGLNAVSQVSEYLVGEGNEPYCFKVMT